MNQSRRSLLHLMIAIPLAGCGLHPLYGTDSGTISVAADLAAVSVPEQQTRAGQLVRNHLLIIMGTDGAAPLYTLGLTFGERTSGISNLPGTTTSRAQYNLKADYKLTQVSDGKQLVAGNLFSSVQYDTVRQPVADLQAKRDAMERASTELAQDLRLRIAAYFADRKS
jgi:LPS-assembly lipoprotein